MHTLVVEGVVSNEIISKKSRLEIVSANRRLFLWGALATFSYVARVFTDSIVGGGYCAYRPSPYLLQYNFCRGQSDGPYLAQLTLYCWKSMAVSTWFRCV